MLRYRNILKFILCSPSKKEQLHKIKILFSSVFFINPVYAAVQRYCLKEKALRKLYIKLLGVTSVCKHAGIKSQNMRSCRVAYCKYIAKVKSVFFTVFCHKPRHQISIH